MATQFFRKTYLIFLLAFPIQAMDSLEDSRVPPPLLPAEIWESIIGMNFGANKEPILLKNDDVWFINLKSNYKKNLSVVAISHYYYEILYEFLHKNYLPISNWKIIKDVHFIVASGYHIDSLTEFLSSSNDIKQLSINDLLKVCDKTMKPDNINDTNSEGSTVISLLTRKKFYDQEIMEHLVKGLIQRGADINQQNEYGNNALVWAVRLDQPRLLRLFIEHNVDLLVRSHQSSANQVHFYTREGNFASRFMTDIEKPRRLGASLLHWAAFCGFFEIVEILLENSMNPYELTDSGDTVFDMVENSTLFRSDDDKKLMLEKLRGTSVIMDAAVSVQVLQE